MVRPALVWALIACVLVLALAVLFAPRTPPASYHFRKTYNVNQCEQAKVAW